MSGLKPSGRFMGGLTVPLLITLRVYLTNPQFSIHSRQKCSMSGKMFKTHSPMELKEPQERVIFLAEFI